MNIELLFALIVAGFDPNEVEFSVRAFAAPYDQVDPDEDTPDLSDVVVGVDAVERKAAEWGSEGYSVAYGLTTATVERLNALFN